MKSFYVVRRQAGFVVAIAALLLALVVPALASAAEVTTRSIELSSASKSAEGVSYTVKFTTGEASANADAFVVDFCDSPSIGAACTPPAGMNAASATSSTAGYTVNGTESSASLLVVEATAPIAASTAVTVTLEGITNPSTANETIYARILTFDTDANAAAYVSTTPGTGVIDTGAVAIAIHDTISVSGAVNESLTFCVSSKTISANCTLQSESDPTLELGEGTGATKALSSGFVSTGNLYAQISTNAVSGATVNLKSSAADCGGLINSSNPDDCFILPALNAGGISAGQAKFGVTVATDATDANGTLQAAGAYNASTYTLNYVDGNEGITSVFGDPILDTAGAPASNKNATLTFGASIANNTPAGKYSTDLSLIATGKF